MITNAERVDIIECAYHFVDLVGSKVDTGDWVYGCLSCGMRYTVSIEDGSVGEIYYLDKPWPDIRHDI